MTKNELQISAEQIIIYNHINDGKNVIVDSIAGSGKSTTIIHIAKLLPHKRFLHVTYNSMLRKEFKQKVASLKLDNIDVHTYHSLAVKYFLPTAFTDTGIREILTNSILPMVNLPKFDIVVLDECQDMTKLYFNFIRLVISLICRTKDSTSGLGWIPDEMDSNPDELDSNPDELDSNPDELDSNPDEMDSNPDEMDSNPDEMDSNPDEMDSNPDEMDSNPDEMDSNPDEMDSNQITSIPSSNLIPPQLLFLGDYMQCLYEFKGADWRFLTLAREIWSSDPLYPPNSFVDCSLKTSYRITNQMSSFVNNVMLGEQRMSACREGSPVIYIRNNRYNLEKIIIHHIKRILKEGDLPSDIFILAPSVKGTFSNVRRLENVLVESGIPCHVPMFENERISDEKVIDGKIVFSTFHSVKGRQRKYVFIMNFDNSYFAFNARNLCSTVCPNTLYVAATRATHLLYLLEINQKQTDRPLDFLKMSHAQMNRTDYIDFKGSPQSVFYEESTESKSAKEDTIPVRRVTPTDLIKFLPESVIEAVTPLLKRIIQPVRGGADPPAEEIAVPTVVDLKNGLYEDVSDLNGVAIPAIYCDHIQKKAGVDIESIPNILWRFIEHTHKDFKEGEHLFLKRVFADLSPFCQTPDQYLYMSNVFIAFQEKLYFKLKQIDRTEYTWLTEEMVAKCNERMDRVICPPPEAESELGISPSEPDDQIVSFEDTFIHYSQDDKHTRIDEILRPHLQKLEKYRFTARVDLVTTKCVWELKFVNELTIDHYLQFAIYAWLWRCVHSGDTDTDFKIFNIRKEEIFRLTATFEELTEIVVLIIKGKYEPVTAQTDDEFLMNVSRDK